MVYYKIKRSAEAALGPRLATSLEYYKTQIPHEFRPRRAPMALFARRLWDQLEYAPDWPVRCTLQVDRNGAHILSADHAQLSLLLPAPVRIRAVPMKSRTVPRGSVEHCSVRPPPRSRPAPRDPARIKHRLPWAPRVLSHARAVPCASVGFISLGAVPRGSVAVRVLSLFSGCSLESIRSVPWLPSGAVS